MVVCTLCVVYVCIFLLVNGCVRAHACVTVHDGPFVCVPGESLVLQVIFEGGIDSICVCVNMKENTDRETSVNG